MLLRSSMITAVLTFLTTTAFGADNTSLPQTTQQTANSDQLQNLVLSLPAKAKITSKDVFSGLPTSDSLAKELDALDSPAQTTQLIDQLQRMD